MTNLRKFGTPTSKVKVYKSESHKLCQSFPVADGVVINEASPVYLKPDGTITNVASEGKYIGISTSLSTNSPYPDKEQTVMVQGYAIIYGVCNSTSAITAGYVEPDETQDNEKGYTIYKDSATQTNFIALSTAEVDGLVQIMVL